MSALQRSDSVQRAPPRMREFCALGEHSDSLPTPLKTPVEGSIDTCGLPTRGHSSSVLDSNASMATPTGKLTPIGVNRRLSGLASQKFLSRSHPAKYVPINNIGEGACGRVWLAQRSTDNAVFVAKVVRLSANNERKKQFALAEPMLMAACNSPFVVRYCDHWSDEEAVVTVMEHVQGMDLTSQLHRITATAAYHMQQVRRLSRGLPALPFNSEALHAYSMDAAPLALTPERAQQLQRKNPEIREHLQAACRQTIPELEVSLIFAQILVGVHHVHSRGILHRDLKSGNIFLCSSGLIKIGDFGLSCFASDAEVPPPRDTTDDAALRDLSIAPFINRLAVGTVHYMAPELWCTDECPVYSEKSDMWALGVILYEMLTCRRPFSGDSKAEIGASILSGDFHDPRITNPSVTAPMVDLLHRLLHPDPAQRPTAREALAVPILRQAAKHLTTALEQHETLPPHMQRSALLDVESACAAPVAPRAATSDTFVAFPSQGSTDGDDI